MGSEPKGEQNTTLVSQDVSVYWSLVLTFLAFWEGEGVVFSSRPEGYEAFTLQGAELRDADGRRARTL